MILFDSLSQSDKDKLADGRAFKDPVGVFARFDFDFTNMYNVGAMCYEYYLGRSGNKSISPFAENVIKLSNNDYDFANHNLSELIKNKYLDKWRKIHGALTERYNVTDTISLEEVKTGNNLDRITYNSQIEDIITKQNSETVTYDSQVEDNGHTGSKETVTRSTNVQDSIYGFNSPVPVGDSSSIDTTTETTEGLPTDNVTNNIRANTGTDTTQVSGTDTDTKTKSGTDTTNRSIDETISRSGRDRDAQKLIQDEINLRIENIFFDIVYKDLDNILTLQIYI